MKLFFAFNLWFNQPVMAKRKNTPPVTLQKYGPEDFRPLLSEEEYQKLLLSLQTPYLPSLRINPLKTIPDKAISFWKETCGWEMKPVPFCPTGFWIEQKSSPISQVWEHKLGHFYIQDAASMLPPELFDFPLADSALVLDMAASPGGKTTHLAARLKDRNLIIANDSSASRLTALRLVLQNQGITNAAITRYAGEQFSQMCPETFDAVLLDAPCSMQGLRSSDTHAIRPISHKELDELVFRQQRLLESAVLAARPGGQIVYSTCTLNPAENEGVVDSILKKYGSILQVNDVSSALPAGAQGLTRAETRPFNPQLIRTARLWPHIFQTAGFYAARLTKTASIGTKPPLPAKSAPPYWQKEILSSAEQAILARQWQQEFEFPLTDILEAHHLIVIKNGKHLTAVPHAVLMGQLPLVFQSAGLEMAEFTPDGYIPAHHWVTRFFGAFQKPLHKIDGQQKQAWLKGLSLPDPAAAQYHPRQIVFLTDSNGLFLGMAKVLNHSFKNLLPRRLVLY